MLTDMISRYHTTMQHHYGPFRDNCKNSEHLFLLLAWFRARRHKRPPSSSSILLSSQEVSDTKFMSFKYESRKPSLPGLATESKGFQGPLIGAHPWNPFPRGGPVQDPHTGGCTCDSTFAAHRRS